MDKQIFECIFNTDDFKNELNSYISELESIYKKQSEKLNIFLTNSQNKNLSGFDFSQVDAPIKKQISNMLTKLSLVYSFNGVKLFNLYNRKQKYNGSEPLTLDTLKNAVKFQILSNHEWSLDLDTKSLKHLCLCYYYKFLKNVNNIMTYNVKNENAVNNPTLREFIYYYDPVKTKQISHYIDVIISELKNNDYSVFDAKRNKITIKFISNIRGCIKADKFYREDIEFFLDLYSEEHSELPTYKELRVFINDYNFNNDIEKFKKLYISSDAGIKYYINMYELSDRIQKREYNIKKK